MRREIYELIRLSEDLILIRALRGYIINTIMKATSTLTRKTALEILIESRDKNAINALISKKEIALEEAVHRQLMSDVPYGVLLRAGWIVLLSLPLPKNMRQNV